MKKGLCIALAISILALLSTATPAPAPAQQAAAAPLSDRMAGELVGGSWSEFFSGVACGAGLVALATGYVSGVGAPGAVILTAGILSQCARALGY